MDSRMISTILIATLLGGVVGFGLSYVTFSSQIQSLQNQMASDLSQVTDAVEDLEDQLPLDWTASDLQALDNHVTEMQTELTDAEVQLSLLNATVSDINAKNWQLVFSFSGPANPTPSQPYTVITDIFPITGNSLLLRREYFGPTGAHYVDLRIHYANGTLLDRLYLQDVGWWIDYSEIPIQEAGNYYLNITMLDYSLWDFHIYDYK